MGIAAKAKAIGAVGRAKRRADRSGEARGGGKFVTVLRIPSGVAAEGRVIRKTDRDHGIVPSPMQLILRVKCVDRGVDVEAGSERYRGSGLPRRYYTQRQQLGIVHAHIVLPVGGVAPRVGKVLRFIVSIRTYIISDMSLLNVIHHAAYGQL